MAVPLHKDILPAMLGLPLLAEGLSQGRILGRVVSQKHHLSVAQLFTEAAAATTTATTTIRTATPHRPTRCGEKSLYLYLHGTRKPALASRTTRLSSASSARTLRAPGICGVHPVVVTPFREDESLDLDSYQHLIRRVAEAGCRGVTILGVMGEANRLVDSERERLVEAAVDAAREIRGGGDSGGGRGGSNQSKPFQVCVGTSHAGTEATVQLCQVASRLGADSVMVSLVAQGADEASVLHLYRRIHEACPDLPIVVQDHPSSTGVHMPASLLGAIAERVPTVACIKLESLPTVDRISALRRRCRSSSYGTFESAGRCSILTGLGALYSGFDLATGETDGFMTGFAFPEVLLAMHEIVSRQSDDDTAIDRMLAVYRHFLPLLVLEQQPGVGLAVRKEIYRRRKWIATSRVRHPGPGPLSPAVRRELDRHLQRSFGHADITQPIPPNVILELSGA